MEAERLSPSIKNWNTLLWLAYSPRRVVPAKFEFSPNGKEVLRHSRASSRESSISFQRQYSGEISFCHFSSSVVSWWYMLFPSLHWIWNSLRNNSVLFNLHFVCTIITLINLNNFKYPTKILLCSQANQNHLLRDFVSFSACWDEWKQRARRHQLCYFS